MEVLLWHFAYGKPKDTVDLKTTHEVRRSVDHLLTPSQVVRIVGITIGHDERAHGLDAF